MDDSVRERLRFAQRKLDRDRRRLSIRVRTARREPLPVRRPVFVLGCPRAGTTLMFALLRRHPALGGFHTEAHLLWEAYQHPARHGWSSDRSTAGSIGRGEAMFLARVIGRVAGDRRFLDKTPKNALRVPYLEALFPDASFVFIHRDGRATVSSLIEGWTARRGVSYRLPERLRLDDYGGRYWSYILPPGWRDLIGTSIAEVAAFQYRVANEMAIDDLDRLDPARVVKVAYEDVVGRPQAVVDDLLRRLDLAPASEVSAFARELDRHLVSSISPPRADKWRARSEQLAPVMHVVEPMMRRLGYTDVEVVA